MPNASSELSILIDIRAKLDALAQTQAGMRTLAEDTKKANEEASGLFSLFKEGLGIGSGMELARRAVELFKDVVRETIGEAKKMAGEIRDGSEALQISGEAYQVFQIDLAKANVGMDRMSVAISTQTQHLAQVRAGAAGAADAYRVLGLNAAELESLTPDQRVLKTAEAMFKATDQTKAFAAAGQILGTRQLPQLLSGLRDLARDYKGAADAAKAAGLIMSDDTARRIDQAQKNIERLKRYVVTSAGELIGLADMLSKSAQKNFADTSLSFAKLLAGGPLLLRSNLTGFLNTVAKNQPPVKPEPESPKLDPAEVARQIELREQLKQSQLQLATVQATAGVADKNNTEDDAAKATRKNALLKMEIDALRQVLDLTEKVQAFDDTTGTEEKAGLLVKQTAELAAAQNALAEADGKGANFAVDRLETSVALLELRKELVRLANDGDPLGDEISLRERLLPILRAQGELYAQIAKAQFPDADALVAKQAAGTIKPDELQRLNAYVVLLQRKNALIKEEPDLKQNNSFTVLPKSAAQRTDEEFGRFQKGRNESGEQRLGAGEGVQAGAQQFVMSLGTQGEQVAAGLQSTLGATVNGISESIYGWATGAGNLGDTVRALQSTVFKTFLDTLVSMGAQWLINAALAKVAMLSTAAVGSAVRKAEAADVVATEAVKTPSLAVNAGFAAAGSFGLSAVIGIALLAALIGAFAAGGFADGGYTGDGGKYEYAGPAHRGEVIFSQADVARFGGAASLDTLRVAGPSRARAVSAPSLSVSSALAAANASAPAKPERMIAIVPDMNSARALQRDPNFESVIVDVVQRRRGEILG